MDTAATDTKSLLRPNDNQEQLQLEKAPALLTEIEQTRASLKVILYFIFRACWPGPEFILVSLQTFSLYDIQSALLQIGLVLRFHRDVKVLGVESYAAKAPQSITRALEQAMKDYEGACDAMEEQLVRKSS